MSKVNLVWITPDSEKLILRMARVSSPDPHNEDTGLLKYLIKHKHWSPFEMASMCVEINTSRAISAQIIRHRSFHFQEFSQRYSEVNTVEVYRARRQDVKNRQNSVDDMTTEEINWFEGAQNKVYETSIRLYRHALVKGIAKEQARMLLPMSSSTKLYMSGTLRDWIQYINLRCEEGTQAEHREIAFKIREIFKQQLPIIGELI